MKFIKKIELFAVYTLQSKWSTLNFANYQKIGNILTKINPDKYIFDYFIAYLINKFSVENTWPEVIFSIVSAVK